MSTSDKFDKTVYAVEADDFAQLSLWAENDQNELVDWQQLNEGQLLTIGYLDDKPITVSLTWSKLDGHYVLFYYSPSVVVDHEIVEKFIRSKLPPETPMTNAMNFHKCILWIDSLNKQVEILNKKHITRQDVSDMLGKQCKFSTLSKKSGKIVTHGTIVNISIWADGFANRPTIQIFYQSQGSKSRMLTVELHTNNGQQCWYSPTVGNVEIELINEEREHD